MSGNANRPLNGSAAKSARSPNIEETSDLEAMLNEYGVGGWKLPDTIDYTGGTKSLIFKQSSDDDV